MSAPSVDALIEVTIKRVPIGIVSNHIHDQVQIGDVIEVIEPLGDFILDGKKNINAIYFWGVSSGITPLIPLIKEVLFSKPSIDVNLIYGNRNFDKTIFLEKIINLLKAYPDKFKAWHFHSLLILREDNLYIVDGSINMDYALDILDGTDGINTRHFICGPAGLQESVKEALSTLNLLPVNILFEDFELVKDQKDFEDIIIQTIKLKFQNTEYALELIKGKSILETALDSGLELPYSCQTGNCSTCKRQLKKGSLKMIGLDNKRMDLLLDEFLLCCSHPMSDNVYIKIKKYL